MATVGVAILLNALIDAAELSIASKNTGPLQDILTVSVLYAVCMGLLVYLSNRYKACYVRKCLISMREALADGILQTSIADYEKEGSASYVTAFNQNFSIIEEKMLQNRISIMDSVICIVLATLVLLYMNPLIAVISIAAMAIPSLLPGKYSPQFSASARHLESSKEHLSSLMAKLYGLTTFSPVVVQFLIMGLSGFFAVRGYITIGSIVAVTQLTGQVISPAFGLSGKIGELKSVRTVMETLRTLSNPEIPERSAVRLLKTRISLQGISFRYADRSILENVSVAFEKGKKYAIIGKSGSGKSTLLKLIAGYYPEFGGDIYTDESAAFPSEAAMIHQNTFLFNDSIRNNLTMWKSCTEQEIMEAVEKAGLTEFVAALPQGLDTLAAENGSNFSGGERQRISVARALLSGKDILLMDEATSAFAFIKAFVSHPSPHYGSSFISWLNCYETTL